MYVHMYIVWSQDNQWVGFDNVDIAVEKAFYVAEEGLGQAYTIMHQKERSDCIEKC